MELTAVILFAGPLGLLARTRRPGLALYLLVWAIIFPIQTAAVHFDSDPAGNDSVYRVVNAAIVAVGINSSDTGWGGSAAPAGSPILGSARGAPGSQSSERLM